ncbi:MAG: hypothetical protein WDA75_20830 [Candidatus Latescibacterota bacterium]|jgi:hypothetical protein
MGSTAVTTRVPQWLDQEVRTYWGKCGVRPSTGYGRAIEEWWVQQNLPLLEYRTGVAGRRAGIRGGPDVWEVALAAAAYPPGVQHLVDHFGGHLAPEALMQAMQYAERFSEAIRQVLDEQRRLEELLGEGRG